MRIFNRYRPRNHFSGDNVSFEHVLPQETQRSHGLFSYINRSGSNLNAPFDRCTSREFCHDWHSPDPRWNRHAFPDRCVVIKTIQKAERGELKVREKRRNLLYRSSPFYHFMYFSHLIVSRQLCEMYIQIIFGRLFLSSLIFSRLFWQTKLPIYRKRKIHMLIMKQMQKITPFKTGC